MLMLLNAPRTMRVRMSPRAARLARNVHGGINYTKLLPLAKRRGAFYFIVRPGETNASLLRFFGRLREGKRAIAELARFNRKKRLGRDGLFATLRAGEFILLPVAWVSRRNAGARSLSGLPIEEGQTPQMLGYTEDDMPPGDDDWSEWNDWLPGDWSTPDPDEGAPDGSGDDIDSVGNKFGIFCESGFHREWSFGWPPVECVSDAAGTPCEYQKDGVDLDGFINRDGACDNGIPKGSGGGGGDPKAARFEPAGPAFEPGIYPGYYDDQDGQNHWCGKGFAYYEKGFACAPYSNKKADEWYDKNGPKKGGGINTGGGGTTPAKSGGGPAKGGGTTPAKTDKTTTPATTPASKSIFQSLTDTTPKKIAIGVAVVLAIAAATSKKKRR